MGESARQRGPFRAGGESGQGLVDYALIIVLVAVAAVGALTLFGGAVSALFASIVSSWP